MDTPSKERLVGAIMFVVLIVLLVPEILSGPHHAASPANAGAGSAAPLRTYTIDLGNPVRMATPAAADAKPPALPPPPPATASVAPASTPPASAASGPKLPAPAPAAPSAVTKPGPAAPAAVATPASDGKEAWGAQLGSFSKAGNAERLAQSLRTKGYYAFVSPTGSGSHVLHRVRVGPEPSRAAAEALVVRLKRDGEAAKVVTLP